MCPQCYIEVENRLNHSTACLIRTAKCLPWLDKCPDIKSLYFDLDVCLIYIQTKEEEDASKEAGAEFAGGIHLVSKVTISAVIFIYTTISALKMIISLWIYFIIFVQKVYFV